MTVPALTLHQPWASLIAEQIKRIETRSWAAPASLVGQYLRIHAAVRKPDSGFVGDYLVSKGEIGPKRVPWGDRSRPLPIGAIVATARLTACVPVERTVWGVSRMSVPFAPDPGFPGPDGQVWHLRPDQEPYGDCSPGRFAWLLDDVAPTTERCPWCMGDGDADDVSAHWVDGRRVEAPDPCPVCDGTGRCEPVPAKGRQRVWGWTP